MLAIGDNADPCISVECVKAILTGIIPMNSDEIGIVAAPDATQVVLVYLFFRRKINAYEQSVAAKILKEWRQVPQF